MRLTPGRNVIYLSFFVTDAKKKSKNIYPERNFYLSPIFASNVGTPLLVFLASVHTKNKHFFTLVQYLGVKPVILHPSLTCLLILY
jgi:hypothetical protein